jgi:alpha-tubulin suppressor-like RCC1 family protein
LKWIFNFQNITIGGKMHKKFWISLIQRTIYGIMLLGVLLATVFTKITSIAYAQATGFSTSADAIASAVSIHNANTTFDNIYQLGEIFQENEWAYGNVTNVNRLNGRTLASSGDIILAKQENDIWSARLPEDGKLYNEWVDQIPLLDKLVKDMVRQDLRSDFDDRTATLTGHYLPWFSPNGAIVTTNYDHHGKGNIDLVLDKNDILSTKSGTIIYANDTHPDDMHMDNSDYVRYNNVIVIKHSSSEFTIYLHLKNNSIPAWIKSGCPNGQIGQECSLPVLRGVKIGEMGSTGWSTGPHLHLSTTTKYYVAKNTDLKDEDHDGNTTEWIYTAFANTADHVSVDFVEYPYYVSGCETSYNCLQYWPEKDPNHKLYSQNRGGTLLNRIAAGIYHTCAMTKNNGVKCWGNNWHGELGNNTTTDSNTPVQVYGMLSGIMSVVTGGEHTCALTAGGAVKCWGYNKHGQLGDNSTTDRWKPVQVFGLGSKVVAISAGVYHTCALINSGRVQCWGQNTFGQIGDGYYQDRLKPVWVAGISNAIAISAGGGHTCALLADGGVMCWGSNMRGQLGNDTNISYPTPGWVYGMASGSGITAISAGSDHTCALSAGGGVKCWGRNDYGQIGISPYTDSLRPVWVTYALKETSGIAAGYRHTCLLTILGGAKCWGSNDKGELGDNSVSNRSYPFWVYGLKSGAITIASGEYHTCALTREGKAKCWGYNLFGQLGNGKNDDSLIPVWVTGL